MNFLTNIISNYGMHIAGIVVLGFTALVAYRELQIRLASWRHTREVNAKWHAGVRADRVELGERRTEVENLRERLESALKNGNRFFNDMLSAEARVRELEAEVDHLSCKLRQAQALAESLYMQQPDVRDFHEQAVAAESVRQELGKYQLN